MQITPEEIYREWHKQINNAKGRNVRPVKNFDKAKFNENWRYFEMCANLVNRNAGMLDYKILITALVENNRGYFHPKRLCSRNSYVTLYKQYIDRAKSLQNPEKIKESVLKSLKYVVYYCKENKIEDLTQYLNHDNMLIPTMLKHYNAGNISIYFLACISNITDYINSYPQDIIHEFLKEDFNDSLSRARIKINQIEVCKKVRNDVESIVYKLIKKET